LCKKRYNLADPRQAAKAAEDMFPLAALAESEVARQGTLKTIAEALGAPLESVWSDWDRWRRQGTDKSPRNKEAAGKGPETEQNAQMTAERFLLLAVFANYQSSPELLARLRAVFSPDDFEDPAARELFISLEEAKRRDIDSFDGALSLVQSEKLRNYAREKAADGEFSQNPERIVDESIVTMRQRKLEKRRKSLVSRMSMLKNTKTDGVNENTEAQIDELLYEKLEIDRELLRIQAARQ
jgi:DNA primase